MKIFQKEASVYRTFADHMQFAQTPHFLICAAAMRAMSGTLQIMVTAAQVRVTSD